MVLKDAGITILSSEEEVTIEIEDNNASIKFVEVTMTPEQFTQALSRLCNTRCSIEVRGLDKVGKKMEIDHIKFEIDPELQWKRDNDDELAQIAEKSCPKGWEVRTYFRSRDSFVREGNKTFVVATIRRWVDMVED